MNNIPQEDKQELQLATMELVKELFDIPGIEEEFQTWLNGKHSRNAVPKLPPGENTHESLSCL